MGGWGTAAFPPLHWVANACSTQSFQGPESRRPLPLTEVFLAVSWPQKTSGLSGKHSCGPSGVCARPFRSLGKTQFFTMRPAVKSSSWNVWPSRLRVFEHPFPSPSGGVTPEDSFSAAVCRTGIQSRVGLHRALAVQGHRDVAPVSASVECVVTAGQRPV